MFSRPTANAFAYIPGNDDQDTAGEKRLYEVSHGMLRDCVWGPDAAMMSEGRRPVWRMQESALDTCSLQ